MLVARRFSISSLSAAIHQDFGAQTCFITARSKLLSYDSIPACELACAASSLPPPLRSNSSFTVHPSPSLSLSLGNALEARIRFKSASWSELLTELIRFWVQYVSEGNRWKIMDVFVSPLNNMENIICNLFTRDCNLTDDFFFPLSIQFYTTISSTYLPVHTFPSNLTPFRSDFSFLSQFKTTRKFESNSRLEIDGERIYIYIYTYTNRKACVQYEETHTRGHGERGREAGWPVKPNKSGHPELRM